MTIKKFTTGRVVENQETVYEDVKRHRQKRMQQSVKRKKPQWSGTRGFAVDSYPFQTEKIVKAARPQNALAGNMYTQNVHNHPVMSAIDAFNELSDSYQSVFIAVLRSLQKFDIDLPMANAPQYVQHLLMGQTNVPNGIASLSFEDDVELDAVLAQVYNSVRENLLPEDVDYCIEYFDLAIQDYRAAGSVYYGMNSAAYAKLVNQLVQAEAKLREMRARLHHFYTHSIGDFYSWFQEVRSRSTETGVKAMTVQTRRIYTPNAHEKSDTGDGLDDDIIQRKPNLIREAKSQQFAIILSYYTVTLELYKDIYDVYVQLRACGDEFDQYVKKIAAPHEYYKSIMLLLKSIGQGNYADAAYVQDDIYRMVTAWANMFE